MLCLKIILAYVGILDRFYATIYVNWIFNDTCGCAVIYNITAVALMWSNSYTYDMRSLPRNTRLEINRE